MKKSIIHNLYSILQYFCIIAALCAAYLMSASHVDALGLKVAPLKYEEHMELGSDKSGFVTVSNPNDTTITVSTYVRGFRQIDLDGNLEFYESEHLSEGIKINVDKFDLGPREAARLLFTVESNKLPEGGVYAVLFFETTAQKSSTDTSSIETGSRVGTLLILENGDKGVKQGAIEDLDVGFWQSGSGIEGAVLYNNTDAELALGFNPELTGNVLWGKDRSIDSGLVLPGVTREFPFEFDGNYFGLLPITFADDVGGSEATYWVFAVTGVWQFIVPFAILALLASTGLYRYYSRRL